MKEKRSKQVVFDENGNPKEIRYYEDDILTARLGVILDGEGNFIGLRELDVEEVSPQSWIDKLFKRKESKRIEINTIDFIGLINWINTIKTVKKIEKIETVEKIFQIDNINNVETVKTLETLDIVNEINLIDQIHTIDYTSMEEQIIRNCRFLLASQFWQYNPNNPPTFTTGMVTLNTGQPGNLCWIRQYVTGYLASTVCFLVCAQAVSGSPTLALVLSFVDGSSEQQNFGLTTEQNYYMYISTSGKRLRYVYLANLSSTDRINLFMVKGVFVKKEVRLREDLLIKSWDLSAGTSTLLNAVSDKCHKIYGWDYECDADGECGFVATVGGGQVKFGRRITKGVHAKTLVYPIVCDVYTALQFVSAGNTKLSLQYVTE